MEEAWGGVKFIAFLMGLSGILLLSTILGSLGFFGFLGFPFGVFAYVVFFPFIHRLRNVSGDPAWLLSILYGAVQLAIAYGLWVKSKSARIALICLGVFWIGYAVWDSLAIRQGTYGNPDYYEIDPSVVASAVYYGIVMAYLFLSRNARAYFGKYAKTATTKEKE